LASVGARTLHVSDAFDEELLPCFVTAGAYVGTKNMALGVLAGLVATVAQRADRVHGAGALRRLLVKDPPGHCPPGAVGCHAVVGSVQAKGERVPCESKQPVVHARE